MCHTMHISTYDFVTKHVCVQTYRLNKYSGLNQRRCSGSVHIKLPIKACIPWFPHIIYDMYPCKDTEEYAMWWMATQTFWCFRKLNILSNLKKHCLSNIFLCLTLWHQHSNILLLFFGFPVSIMEIMLIFHPWLLRRLIYTCKVLWRWKAFVFIISCNIGQKKKEKNHLPDEGI